MCVITVHMVINVSNMIFRSTLIWQDVLEDIYCIFQIVSYFSINFANCIHRTDTWDWSVKWRLNHYQNCLLKEYIPNRWSRNANLIYSITVKIRGIFFLHFNWQDLINKCGKCNLDVFCKKKKQSVVRTMKIPIY